MIVLTNSTASTITVNASVWFNWNSTTVEMPLASLLTHQGVWASWCASGTVPNVTATTIAAVNASIWTQWSRGVSEGHIVHRSVPCGAPAAPVRIATPEEAARDEARLAAYQAEVEAKNKAAIEADARAEKLLIEHLTQAQRECLRANGHFFVEVSGRRYRIDRAGKSGNVRLVDEAGKIKKKYCIHDRWIDADSVLPVSDNLLAQKLLLETDEAAFLRIANAS